MYWEEKKASPNYFFSQTIYYSQDKIILLCLDMMMLQFRYQQAPPTTHSVHCPLIIFHPYWKTVLTPYWFKNTIYIALIDLILNLKKLHYVPLKSLNKKKHSFFNFSI